MTVVTDNGIKELSEGLRLHDIDEQLRFASCLKNYIDRHGEANQSFDTLRALTRLTLRQLEKGRDGTPFTAQNILAEAGIQIADGKAAGGKLSPLWKNLVENSLPAREKGMQDFARNQGLQGYLWPEKLKSDGGRPSEYFFTVRPVPPADVPEAELLPGQLHYIRELTPEPSWWAKPLLKNGYRLEGWRRQLFLAYGVGVILAVAVGLLLLWGLFWSLPMWPVKEFALTVFASAVILAVFWHTLGPLFRLLEWRIVMAPTSLVALNELNVQMEIMRESNSVPNSPGTIRLVRYSGTCPLCTAKIELANGGKEFPNRLIGRCRENPGEHVYSFDRFTCKGKSLRA